MVSAVCVVASPGQISPAYASGVTGRDFAEEHQINLVLRQLTEWRDSDEPMIEAIGAPLAFCGRGYWAVGFRGCHEARRLSWRADLSSDRG